MTSDDTCGATRTVAGKRFVCIRPDHGWYSHSALTVLNTRRRRGIVSNPDRHYFVREDRR